MTHVKDWRQRFVNLGSEVVADPPEQLAELVRRGSALYAKVIRGIGLTPE